MESIEAQIRSEAFDIPESDDSEYEEDFGRFYVLGFKTFEEFMCRWRPYVERSARKMGFNNQQDLDDIVQDIFMEFWSKGYESVFDPTKATWSTFFTAFIRYRLYNRLTKGMRDPLLNSLSVESSSDEYSHVYGVVDLDRLVVDGETPFDNLMLSDRVSRIKLQIGERLPNRRGYVPEFFLCKRCKLVNENPQVQRECPSCGCRKWKAQPQDMNKGSIERSHVSIFDMLLESRSRKEIASILKYSEATVSIMIRDLAEIPLMNDLWEYCHGISNLIEE